MMQLNDLPARQIEGVIFGEIFWTRELCEAAIAYGLVTKTGEGWDILEVYGDVPDVPYYHLVDGNILTPEQVKELNNAAQ